MKATPLGSFERLSSCYDGKKFPGVDILMVTTLNHVLYKTDNFCMCHLPQQSIQDRSRIPEKSVIS